MKNKKILLFAVCLLFISTSSCILADDTPQRELFFGPVISNLEGTGITTSKLAKSNALSSGGVPLVFSENKQGDNRGNAQTLHFSIDTDKVSLNTVRGKDYVKIEGLKPHGHPGEAQLPFKSFVVVLPVNSKVSGINVSNVSYRPLFNKLDIISAPMPVANMRDKQQNENQTTNIQESYSSPSKCKTCQSESFFPGDLVYYMTSENNENLFVFIKFFPMQYISKTKQAILITDADITVNYQLADAAQTGENR